MPNVPPQHRRTSTLSKAKSRESRKELKQKLGSKETEINNLKAQLESTRRKLAKKEEELINQRNGKNNLINTKINELNEKLTDAIQQVEREKQLVKSLDAELAEAYRIKSQQAIKIQEQMSAIRTLQADLSSTKDEIETVKGQLHNEKQRNESLIQAVKAHYHCEIVENINYHAIPGNDTCNHCGGDGGINQGCRPCEGTGRMFIQQAKRTFQFN